MSSPYLGWLIREQIDRTKSLKDAIPDSLRHAALVQLASACKGALDRQVRQLGLARTLLDGAEDAGAATALGIVRDSARVMAEIEWYAIPTLRCQSDQTVFLNDVLSAMHCETGLLPPRPAAASTSHEYYFTHLPTWTIQVPLSEAGFLLHLPDFYHELGHMLYYRQNRDARYRPIMDGAADAARAVDRHYARQANGAELGGAAPGAVAWMQARWNHTWIQESFCDLFALFAAGPAYAYSNLHLVSKTDTDMYRLVLLGRQDHPSGEARMRLLDAGMRILGYAEEAAHVRREWDVVARHFGPPRTGYDLAFPSSLLEAIASSALLAFGRAGLRGYRAGGGNGTEGAGATPVAAALNDAWRAFWRGGDAGFRELEKTMVSRLASVARDGAAGAC